MNDFLLLFLLVGGILLVSLGIPTLVFMWLDEKRQNLDLVPECAWHANQSDYTWAVSYELCVANHGGHK